MGRGGSSAPITCISNILGDPGADSGVRESLNGRKNGTKKSREQQKEPLGTMSHQTSSKWLLPFYLLIGQKNTKVFWHQSGARTALVRHCPQGLFSLFFTFLRAIFSRPFRLSLAPTIFHWVFEDVSVTTFNTYSSSPNGL